jgi:starch phosphorylase
VEANALYDILEKEVVPLFYDRDERRRAARLGGQNERMPSYLNTPMFNTARMVKDYARRAYFTASDRRRG